MVEVTATEQNKEKRMKVNENSLDLWDNIKHPNIWIIGVPKEEEKKKVYEKIFEEIIVENIPNMENEIVNQVQEVQRAPHMMNPTRSMPRHMLIKLRKTKHKKKIKSSKGEATSNIQGKPHMLNSWFFSTNSAGQKGMAGYI